ncbi:MAG TPA: succinate CoA transferase [Candidatus Limnocylindrales bacterium]|nr:succinate CoA transferase [Candidatus Limnocylindrales bacterium]
MPKELHQFFDTLRGRTDLSLEELVELAVQWVPVIAGRQARYKVTEIPSERMIRYYATSGVIDRPLPRSGTRAVYGYRHILQILVVKALQSRDLPLRKIRTMIAGRPDDYLEAVLHRVESDRWESVELGPGVELRIRGVDLPPEEREKVVTAAEKAVAEVVRREGLPGGKKTVTAAGGRPGGHAGINERSGRMERSGTMLRGQRIKNKELKSKITYATDAAELIRSGYKVGMSGFTGSGYPKLVPQALAEHILREHSKGGKFRIVVMTGASTSSELDGALAMVDGIELRMPYNSDPVAREKINFGKMEYFDFHLGAVAQYVTCGFFGDLDTAIIEVTGITEDGKLIPSTSVGNNQVFIDCAREVILEVNYYHPLELEGMHDVYEPAMPPNVEPIMILKPSDRVGTPYLTCPPEKIKAIVETNHPDRTTVFKEPDADSKAISGHILDFFRHEVKKGRLPENLLPLQSGVGNVANAVLFGLLDSEFENLTVYTEVIQDGMLALIDAGKITFASSTAFSVSPPIVEKFKANVNAYKDKILLRPQSISNHVGIIKRLGVLAMNGCVEFDLYGNVNSTHVNGTRIINGIGGSGDFARNSFISIFTTPSLAARGDISCVVPMVSHVDHCEHDVDVVVTEQGLADLRGTSPKQRAVQIIDKCVHPDYRPALKDYYRRALNHSPGKHTPHLIEEAFSWHTRYMRTGSMKG